MKTHTILRGNVEHGAPVRDLGCLFTVCLEHRPGSHGEMKVGLLNLRSLPQLIAWKKPLVKQNDVKDVY